MIVINKPELNDKVIGANGAVGKIVEDNAPQNLEAIVSISWECAGRPAWYKKTQLTWDGGQTAFILDCDC